MKRTHTVTAYRRTITQDAKNRQTGSWAAISGLTGIGANLQAKSAGLRAMEAGIGRTGSWRGFFPEGTALEEKDVILVTAGPGPARLEVTFVDDQGTGWDVEADLERSGEDFGA